MSRDILGNLRQLVITLSLLAIPLAAGGPPATADPVRELAQSTRTAGDLLAVLKGVPGVSSLPIKNVKKTGGVTSATITLRKKTATVVGFTAGGSKLAAVVPSSFALADIIPAPHGTPADGITFADMAFIVVPKGHAKSRVAAATLPGDVKKAVSHFGTHVSLREGLNLFGQANFNGANAIRQVLQAIGRTDAHLPLAGAFSADLFQHNPKTASQKIKDALLTSLKLDLPLPKLSIPGMPNIVKVNNARLAIVGKEVKGVKRIFAGVTGGLDVTLGSKAHHFAFGILAPDPGKQFKPEITAESKDKVSLPFFKPLELTGLSLKAVKKGSKWNTIIDGKAKLNNKSVIAEIHHDPKTGNSAVIETEITLADLAPGIGHVPGLTDVKFTKLVMSKDHVEVVGKIKGLDTVVAAFRHRNKRYIAVNTPHAIKISSLVPPAKGTPLDSASFEHMSYIWVPKGGAAKNLKLSVLPDDIARQAKFTVEELNLKEGLNVIGHMAIQKTSEIGKLLSTVGAYKSGLPLVGTLSPKIFHPGSASQFKNEILDNLEIKIDLPKLTGLGLPNSVKLSHSYLEIKGVKKGNAREIDVNVAGELSVKAGGQTMAFDYDVEVKKTPGKPDEVLVIGRTKAGKTLTVNLVEKFTLTDLSFTMNKEKEKWGWIVWGKSKLGSKEIDLNYQHAVDDKSYLNIHTRLTVADIVGKTDLPGLNDVKSEWIQIFDGFWRISMKVKGIQAFVNIHKPKGATKRAVGVIFDNFSPATVIPGAANSPLKDAMFKSFGLLYHPEKTTKVVSLADIGPDVAWRIRNQKGTITLKPGLNVVGALDVTPRGEIASLLKQVGVTEVSLPLRGTVSPRLFAKGAVTGQLKNEILDHLDIKVNLPAPKIAALDQYLTFTKGHLELKGKLPDGKRGIALKIAGDTELKVKNEDLAFHVEVDYDRSQGAAETDLEIKGHTDKPWKKPLGISFLDLTGLTLDIKKRKAADGKRTYDVDIAAKADIGSHSKLDVRVDVHEVNGQLTDAFFELDGPLNLSDIPDVNKVPHADKFALTKLIVSEHGIEADTTLGGHATDLFAFRGSGWNIALTRKDFNLGELIPTPGNLLKEIKFPFAAVMLSESGLNKPFKELSKVGQDALKDIFTDTSGTVDIKQGLALVAGFHPKHSGKLAKHLKKMGVHDGIVLMGEFGGLFGGTLSVTLEGILASAGASGLPKFMSFLKGEHLNFFLSASKTEFDLGLDVGLTVKVKKDTLDFDTKIAIKDVDAGELGIGITGGMEGTWHNPFDIPGFSVSDVLIDATVDDAGVKLGFTGSTTILKDKISVASDIQLSEALLPDAVAFKGKADEVDIFFVQEVAANMIGKAFNLDIPQGIFPVFKKPSFAFVSAGAEDQAIGLTSEGFGLSGQMSWLGHDKLGEIKLSISPATGIYADGGIADINLSPLELKENHFNMKIGLSEKAPSIKVNSNIKIDYLGLHEKFDVVVNKHGVKFDATASLSKDVSMTTDFILSGVDLSAKSPSLKDADFLMKGDLTLDIGKFIAGPGKAAVTDIFNKLNEDFTKGLKAVKAAQTKVDGLTAKVNAARAKVRKAKARAESKVQGAENRVDSLNSKLSSEWSSYHSCHGWHKWPCRIREGIKIGWTKAELRTADAILDLAKSAISHFPVDLDPTVAALLIERDAAKSALYLAQKAIEGLDVLAPVIKEMATALASGLDKKGIANSINIKKASFEGDLSGVIKNDEPVDLTIDVELFGKEITDTFVFKLKDPEFDVEQVGLLGLYAIEHLIGYAIKDIPGPLKNKLRGVLATKMHTVDASRKRELAKYSLDFAGYGAAANALQEQYTDSNIAFLEAQYANMTSPLDPEISETITNDMIEVGHTGLCLSRSKGKIVELACDGKAIQRWTTKPISGAKNVTKNAGYVYLTQASTGDCIVPTGTWISVTRNYKDADNPKSDTFTFLEPTFHRSKDDDLSVQKCVNSKEYYWKILKHGDGWYQFANLASSQCLHFENSSAMPGDAKAVWKPCTGAANQVYRTSDSLTPKYHSANLAILNVDGNVCVENSSTGKENMRLSACNSANKARFNYSVDIRGDVKFVNRKTGKCLQPNGYSDHTDVVERECTQVDFQWWTVTQETGGQLIKNSQSKLCMVFPVTTKKLQVTKCSDDLKSVVNFIRVDNSIASVGTGSTPVAPPTKPGAFHQAQLKNGNGFCIDESTGKMTKGVFLNVWSCNDKGPARTRQLWTQNEYGQILASNNLCLDVNNPSAPLGVRMIIWSCNGGTGPAHQRQRFRVLYDGQIQHIGSGFCIGSSQDGAKGGQVQLQTCKANSLSQTFNKPASFSGKDTFKPRPGAFTNVQLVNGRRQCVDTGTGKLTKGVSLIVWGCNNEGAPRTRQLWTQNESAQIISSNGLCLDIENPWPRPGVKLIYWGCNNSGQPQLRQRWQILSDGRIKHIHSGFCMDTTESGNRGGEMILATCVKDSPSQTYNREHQFLGSPGAPTESRAFSKVNLVSGRGFCLDSSTGAMTKDAALNVWDCNGVGSAPYQQRQMWTQQSSGQITVSNGLCLDVGDPNVVKGIKLILWTCNGGSGPAHTRQRWRVQPNGAIQHIESGFCIDSVDKGRRDGQVQLQTCKAGSPSQTFTFGT